MYNKYKNALIYCRVASKKQKGRNCSFSSLNIQEAICRKFAEGHGYKVLKIYRDIGKSGVTINRPSLLNLLTKCWEDDSVDAVIVQGTDRLTRSIRDYLLVRSIFKRTGVKLEIVDVKMFSTPKYLN
jgi:DNA invertase Pin-like site-specific DNA recombinase